MLDSDLSFSKTCPVGQITVTLIIAHANTYTCAYVRVQNRSWGCHDHRRYVCCISTANRSGVTGFPASRSEVTGWRRKAAHPTKRELGLLHQLIDYCIRVTGPYSSDSHAVSFARVCGLKVLVQRVKRKFQRS